MAWTIDRPSRRLQTDVLVVGGGCAGVMAAAAAARSGARTLLIERDGCLGGVSTGVLDTFYGFFAPSGPRVVGGLPWEVAETLCERGWAFHRPNTYGAGTGVTYNPQRLKLLWDELLETAGAQVLLHCVVADVHHDSGRVDDVLALCGTELLRISARAVVDASGDGVVSHLAGASAETYADVPNPQSMTTTFTMAPVDRGALTGLGRKRFAELVAEHAGAYGLSRRDGSVHATTADGVEFVHMTRIAGRDPRDPELLSEAEREGRRQVASYARFLRERVPGFEVADIVWTSRRIGVRESRRIVGRYWLTLEDVVEGRRFADGVVQGAAPVEDHAGEHGTRWEFLRGVYEIPWGCLVPAGTENLLVAGRCFSASHDAHASARNMAQCMGMGQAAGVGAALLVDGEVDDPVDGTDVRARLVEAGCLLGGATANCEA